MNNEKMNPEEYRQMKQQERQEVFDLLSQSTQTLLKPEELQQYLDLQSRFLQMSASNVLLVKAQNPDATWLRTFEDWKQDNVSIKRGELGLKAMESSYYQKDDGTMGRSMKVVRLFDISQTTAADRQISRPSYRNAGEYLSEVSGYRTEPSDVVPEGIDALWDQERDRICVRPGLDKDREFYVTAREIACREMAGESRHRDDVLPYAECAAYMLTKHYGMEAPVPDLEKLTQHFPGMEEKDVRSELNHAKQTAGVLDAKILEARQRNRDDRESLR